MKKYISLLFLFLLSCSQQGDISGMDSEHKSLSINAADINMIASKKIYFGHQSVGYNIMDALTAMIPADSGLVIKETDNPDHFKKSVFAHSKNGENLEPQTKIESFVRKMDSGLGNKADIALFKFCYVDVTAATDVNTLFAEYKKAMDRLIKKYSKTVFLHVTVPVTTEEEGLKNKIKSVIKSLIGRKTGFEIDNIKRMEFNTLIKKEYNTKVFDLALFESSTRAGKEILSQKGGVQHQALLKEYTTDGGHLNSEGSNYVVLNLVDFIVNQTK